MSRRPKDLSQPSAEKQMTKLVQFGLLSHEDRPHQAVGAADDELADAREDDGVGTVALDGQIDGVR